MKTAAPTPFSRILQTREARQALARVLPEALMTLAGRHPLSRRLAGMLAGFLKKTLAPSANGPGNPELVALFQDPGFVRDVLNTLPEMAEGVTGAAQTAASTISGMAPADQASLSATLISGIMDGRSGALVTAVCRIINVLHQEDPEFFTKALGPGFQTWVESVDFGEIRELFDTSAQDGRAFVEMANRVLWQYPAKAVLILSFLPSALNFAAEASRLSAAKLNELPPDMMTDVILSFLQEINTAAVSGLVNEAAELLRKLHTGSALQGDPGAPQLPRTAAQLVDGLMKTMDPALWWKARAALADIHAAIHQAMDDALFRRPDLLRLHFTKGPEITNCLRKTKNHRLSLWDALPDADMAEILEGGLAAHDVQELAETCNHLLRLLNRLGDQRPELFADLAGRFANALDPFELNQAAARMLDGPGQTVSSIARAVAPKLIVWMCGVLAPGDDEYEEEAEAARAALGRLINNMEEG